ncbi:AAA family ATPase [uncultured Sphaerochaeta sp.]|uniref:AAA family ATPase n=1 Tax=uncultured Sphaerochaeta sp. TaxID=886478 RepID=UPI0029CA96D1|nr:AAA family ATPase [uncultured Sphaerochaeta sp.]
MITLKRGIEKSGLSMNKVADSLGVSASQLSLVASHNYSGWQQREIELIESMVSHGLLRKEDADLEPSGNTSTGNFRVDPYRFITTQNVIAIDTLAKDLLDPTTTLNASIGVVMGHAGYGKTTAIQHFCSINERAIYVLYVEGYTLNMLMQQIVHEFNAVPNRTFAKNMETIKTATCVYRRLIVIDEADRLPIKYLESLRGLNEVCGVPIMLVGEHTLATKMTSLPRLESRVRSKPVIFSPLSPFDVGVFYKDAVGIDLGGDEKMKTLLLKRCRGDFRIMVNDAHRIVSAMNASGITELTKEVTLAVK